MTEKQMLTRVQHKHDIEANWEKAKTFIPKNGEIIVYDADETHLRPRIKIGDGIKTVGNLDFITDESSSMVSGKTIVQNTNLDELTAYGNYMCTTFAVLKTLLNCPTDKLFTMRVGPAVPGYSDRLYQEIITRTGIRFYRNANVTDDELTWEEWKRTFDENSFYVPTKFGGIDFNSSFERGREAHLESCQAFVNKMNEVAVQLGMTNTTYKTPSGLCCVPINKDERDPKFDIAYNSYTTAYDQLRLMIAARHSPTVYQIMGTQKYSYIMNNNNAGFYRINHSILNSEEWITWQANNNYIIRAAKGGSLDGERSEMDGKPILNFMGIIESNSQLYAVAVVGLVNHEDDLRIVVKDLIEAVNTRNISQYLSDVTNQEKRKYPAGVAAAKLTSFTYDQDIDEALADGIFIEENRQYPSASLAKVMTGLVASSYLNNQECVLNYDDYIDSHDGLSPDFTPGCTTSIIEALHVSLMISHNSTTTMLARICGEKIKGTSVTIKSIEESAVDGGSNIITFSDGKTLTVRNGNTGAAGTNGKSAYDYAKDGGYTQSEANFTEALGKLDLSVALTASKSIPKDTDLDTITTYDNYKCTSQSILESLTNCPTKDFFSMRVGSTAKGVPNYHYQEIITIRGTRYYRDVTNILDGKLNWKPWEISFDTRTLIPANCGGMGLNISSDFGEEKHLAACNKFITKMNKTALEIGMINTEFKTPTGLCSESINSSKTNFDIKYNSHSTAYDYLRLMITVRHTPAVYEAMGQKNYRYFKNGEPKSVGHSNLDNSNWEKWQKDTGYTIRAIKGGSLDATYGEINGKPIMNFVFLIEDGTNNSYAVIVLGQDGTDTNNKYTVLRQYIEDLIDMTNGSPISETIQNATAPTVNGGFPVCMAAMKLTGGTYDSDIEALENSQNVVLLNAHESRVTASIAKVMSAIVAIRYMGNNLSQVNYDDMVGGGSSDTFVLGDIVSTTDAFNLMLGRSDNTMTTMLARICGEKIIEAGSGGGGSGEAGADGFSPIAKVTQTSNGATISITDKSGTTTATIVNGKDGSDGQDGYTPQKNVDYFDGKDGTSATHSWNGTILTITSASGTSSANLKGDKGDKGDSIKGDPGSPGADGVSPTVAVSKSGKVTTVSITDKNGTKTATINDGADGAAGSAGKDGTSVTVKNVSESTADGGSNVVTFSDGKTLTIKNGKTGSKGADGYTPQKGVDYFDGSPGKDGSDGADGQRGTGLLPITTAPSSYTTTTGGFTPVYRIALSTVLTQSKLAEVLVGDILSYSYYHYPVGYVDASYVYLGTRRNVRGATGSAGSAGKNGADGYTPVKGTDYWTEADQEAIVQQVIDAMGGSVVGTVDANNNIVFRGYLANGAYTLKYEDADGNIVDCGTITVSANESGGGSGGNDSGMGDSGSIPLTWSMGVKLDKNTGAEASGSGYAASSHVELVDGYAYTFNQLDNGYGNTYGGANICYYDASGNGIGYELLWDALSGVKSKALTPISGAKTFRVRLYCGENTNEGTVRAFFSVTYAKV